MSIKDKIYDELKSKIEELKKEIEDNNIILNSLLKEFEELNEN